MKKIFIGFIMLFTLSACSSSVTVSNLYKNKLFDFVKFSKGSIIVVQPRDVSVSSDEYKNYSKKELMEYIAKQLQQKFITAYNNSNVFISNRSLMKKTDLMTNDNKERVLKYIKTESAEYYVIIGAVAGGSQSVTETRTMQGQYGGTYMSSSDVDKIIIPIDIWGKAEGRSLLSFSISEEIKEKLGNTRVSSDINSTLDAVVEQISLYQTK